MHVEVEVVKGRTAACKAPEFAKVRRCRKHGSLSGKVQELGGTSESMTPDWHSLGFRGKVMRGGKHKSLIGKPCPYACAWCHELHGVLNGKAKELP